MDKHRNQKIALINLSSASAHDWLTIECVRVMLEKQELINNFRNQSSWLDAMTEVKPINDIWFFCDDYDTNKVSVDIMIERMCEIKKVFHIKIFSAKYGIEEAIKVGRDTTCYELGNKFASDTFDNVVEMLKEIEKDREEDYVILLNQFDMFQRLSMDMMVYVLSVHKRKRVIIEDASQKTYDRYISMYRITMNEAITKRAVGETFNRKYSNSNYSWRFTAIKAKQYVYVVDEKLRKSVCKAFRYNATRDDQHGDW